jgi:hypothetical protein
MSLLQAREEKAKKIGKRELNPSGDWSIITLEQASYTAQEKTNSLFVVIQPEAGLTYRASAYSKFTARLQYGISLGDPLISREFNDFPLNGTQTNSQHNLRGDYWVIQVGYQVSLK